MASYLTPKYLRAHPINFAASRTEAQMWIMKAIYEFWGYCFHGENELTGAKGFPTGGVKMPAGFEHGTLLRTGSTAYTNVGEPYFRDDSADFLSGTLEGKFLVAWKSGSQINDDGIYEIQKVIDSGTMQVAVAQGATPYTGTLEPLFTARSSINYRILDFEATATSLTPVSGDGLVFEFSGANQVNPEQALPHVGLMINGTDGQMRIEWSPSGSWDGTYFGADARIAASRDWFNNVSGTPSTGHMTLICASDFMICHARGATWQNSAGSGFHIEIPRRLYPSGSDPNPIAISHWADTAVGCTGDSYGSTAFFVEHPPTNDVRSYECLTVAPMSTHTEEAYVGDRAGAALGGRYTQVGHNAITDKFWTSDVLLGLLGVQSQFCLARLRMRRFRLMQNIVQTSTRIGDAGEWIQIREGVLWPWDNATLPHNLLFSGI